MFSLLQIYIGYTTCQYKKGTKSKSVKKLDTLVSKILTLLEKPSFC